MGAITKRHQGIRHLRKDITHIQLSMDYSKEYRAGMATYLASLSEPLQFNYNLLMTKKDLKDVLLTPQHISLANKVIDLILVWLKEYRKSYPVIQQCQSCKHDICDKGPDTFVSGSFLGAVNCCFMIYWLKILRYKRKW